MLDVSYGIRLKTVERRQLAELAQRQDRKPAEVVRRLIRLAYSQEFGKLQEGGLANANEGQHADGGSSQAA